MPKGSFTFFCEAEPLRGGEAVSDSVYEFTARRESKVMGPVHNEFYPKPP